MCKHPQEISDDEIAKRISALKAVPFSWVATIHKLVDMGFSPLVARDSVLRGKGKLQGALNAAVRLAADLDRDVVGDRAQKQPERHEQQVGATLLQEEVK